MRPTRLGFGAPITLLASAARTAATASSPQDGIPSQYRGVAVVVIATASSDTPSVTFTIQDSPDGNVWTNRLASTALTGAGARILVAHPSVSDVNNLTDNVALGVKWRVNVTVGDADSLTYSVLAWPLI